MAALLAGIALVLGFYRDLGHVFRDAQTRVSLIWVAILLLIGTLFYAQVEGWSLVDAFYFSVVTLTTVGYGDLSPATTAGKLFTTIYIFGGLSVVVVFANAVTNKHVSRVGSNAKASADAESAEGRP